MTGIEYEVKTSADLKALRDTEAFLRQQIIVAQAAGKNFGDLEKRLDSVSQAIKSIPAPKRIALEMGDMVQGLPVIGNFARALNGLGGPITLAIGGLAALVQGSTKAIAAFAGAETQVAKLDAVLASNGQLTDSYRAKIQDLASQLQKTTAIADDKWLSVLARLTQFGVDESNIEHIVELVVQVALDSPIFAFHLLDVICVSAVGVQAAQHMDGFVAHLGCGFTFAIAQSFARQGENLACGGKAYLFEIGWLAGSNEDVLSVENCFLRDFIRIDYQDFEGLS